MRYKSFQQLPKVRQKSAPAASRGHRKQSRERESEKTDRELFLEAVQDVEPLNDNAGGRKIVPSGAPPPAGPKEAEAGEKEGGKYLQDLVDGKVEFEIEMSTEYLQGNVRGLDPRTFRKLKSGRFSPEAHLDLHGMNAEDARIRLILFVKEHYLNGKRCLLIIPGRGKNSPLGRGVLREHIQDWLTRDPLKRVVLAFATARQQHGGAGAIYVLLRKYKKSRGKIFWEKLRLEGDL
jgi:DNA-nicking Smr family endonuclease